MSARKSAPAAEPKIPPRPPQLLEAARLANAALEQLVAAREALPEDDEFDDLYKQLEEGRIDLESAIGYMTAVPELGYHGQHIHGDHS